MGHENVDQNLNRAMEMFDADNYNDYGTYEEDTDLYDSSLTALDNANATNTNHKDPGSVDSYITKVQDDSGTTVCFSCNSCGKTMARKDHMKNHIQTHFPYQAVKCQMCGFMSKNMPSLKMHISKCKKFQF